MRALSVVTILALPTVASAVDPEVPGEGAIGTPEEDPETETPPQQMEPGEPEEPAPELMPRLTLAESVGWIFEPAPRPSDPEQIAEDRTQRYFDDVVHRDQLRAGLVDGWYFEVARAVRESIDVDANEIIQERRRGMNGVQRLWDELRRYGRGPGRPIDVPGTERTDSQHHFDDLEQANLERMDQENCLNAAVNWYLAHVRITQAPDGELQAAWIVRSSGNAVVDRAALRAVREGVPRVGPPPELVVGERNAIVSEWSVDIGEVATQWNQLCMVGGLGGVLGRGIVRTRLRLLRVIDAQHETDHPQDAANDPEGDAERALTL